MTLQQLRYLCRLVDCGLNISQAARTLHTSQPGVSRYLHLLEDELGLQLFVRDKKRIVGLTPAAQAIVAVCRRMVSDADNLEHIAKDYRAGDAGDLTVATFHTHARYTLPPVIERFTRRYPRVRLRLRQGYLSQIAHWVKNGEADLFVATAPSEPVPELVLLPCHELHRVILTPPGHPLLGRRRVALEDVAAYPVMTYDYESAARSQVMRAFHKKHLSPNVVVRATDADVMKTYVQRGVGIAIVAHTAYDRRQDSGLRAIDARHLFESSTVHIGLRRNAYLSNHMMHFIELVAPRLRRAQIESAVNSRAP
ncbi:MAG: LysR family transcriptional regulator [Betaproteobacteria bacterium]|nr:LysR family transcriptional regulator [Betaproteobacteria bacterium]